MKKEIDVYTDSSKKVITVDLLKVPVKNCSVDIYDKSGTLIKQVKLTEQISYIEIGSLSPGIYVLIFFIGKKIRVFRFLKE